MFLLDWLRRRKTAPENRSGGPFLETTVADGDMVEDMFEAILGRRLGDPKAKAEVDGVGSIRYWIERLVGSDEFLHRFARVNGPRPPSADYIRDENFRTPSLCAPPSGRNPCWSSALAWRRTGRTSSNAPIPASPSITAFLTTPPSWRT